MQDLIVRIDGGVKASNFSEFKEVMLVKIKEADIPLVSDEDFSVAEKTVKVFKEAEDKISLAKHNAMRSTEDIAQLFESFDELSTELRNVRLSLNKKVTQEKANRKMQVIDAGCEKLEKSIDIVAETVPEIHNAIRVERAMFEKAVSGKRSIEKMQEAIDETLAIQEDQLTDLQVLLLDNKRLISECEFPTLFPDHVSLVCKQTSIVKLEIEGRVAKHKLAEKERKEKEAAAVKAEEERKSAEAKETPAEAVPEPEERQQEPEANIPVQSTPVAPRTVEMQQKEEQPGNFVLTVNLSCVPSEAKGVASQVNNLIGNYNSVTKIGLTRA